jgi:hypothetical protein
MSPIIGIDTYPSGRIKVILDRSGFFQTLISIRSSDPRRNSVGTSEALYSLEVTGPRQPDWTTKEHNKRPMGSVLSFEEHAVRILVHLA